LFSTLRDWIWSFHEILPPKNNQEAQKRTAAVWFSQLAIICYAITRKQAGKRTFTNIMNGYKRIPHKED
jgi:hypothetical protein